jgi:soluble lytic murein transglycosylase-like protein
LRRLALVAPILVLLAAATPARASFAHTVVPGETLWSIAMQDGLAPSSLAAFNGLSSDTQVIIGQTIQIPPVGAASGAASSTTTSASEPAGDDAQDGTSTASSASSASPPPMGAYRVQLGDTLSAIAARAGVPTSEIAAMNGLTLAGPLLAGTVIKLPSGAPQAAGTPGLAASDAASTTSVTSTSTTPTIIPAAAPNATPMRLDSSTIGQIATAEGVPPSLASAVAWQESGFNNGVVSSANARGVMQIIPGTWQWVQNNLTRRQLDPSSATDNVRAGSLYLGSLLRSTGGDVRTAIAGYYQGLGSVRSSGMFPDTQQYVANVMALMPRFGG